MIPGYLYIKFNGVIAVQRTIHVFIFLGLIVLITGMFVLNNAPENDDSNVHEAKAVVLEIDDSDVIQSGISKIGYQLVTVKITEGQFKGLKVTATNQLQGKLELDSYYRPGDKMVVALMEEGGRIMDARTLEIYRQDWLLVLFGIFVFCLIIYAKVIGLKSLFSFIASLYVIWNFLIPGLLDGKNPLVIAALVLVLLSGLIIFSVAGFTRKGAAAFIGTMSGLLITIGITLFIGDKLAMNGMTSPFAETLLFSGHLDLNMKYIFYAAIIIGASGAAMDIAMDVAASMEEIKTQKPDINMQELVRSGFNVGRAVICTMTTTLLLAYSGGYLTLLMLFMEKNSSFIRMLNMKMVAAEIMRTLVGSIGLVLVAPITAIVAGWILSLSRQKSFSKASNVLSQGQGFKRWVKYK